MQSIKLFLATGFGSGLMRPAPGTWGSFLAAILFYGVAKFEGITTFFPITILTVVFSALNFWSAEAAIQKWGKDPSQMVLDEWAGLGLAFSICLEWFPMVIEFREITSFFSPEIGLFVAIFILFRFFDVIKPLGIRRLQKINGAMGILIDDLAAGGLTAITLNVLSRLI